MSARGRLSDRCERALKTAPRRDAGEPPSGVGTSPPPARSGALGFLIPSAGSPPVPAPPFPPGRAGAGPKSPPPPPPPRNQGGTPLTPPPPPAPPTVNQESTAMTHPPAPPEPRDDGHLSDAGLEVIGRAIGVRAEAVSTTLAVLIAAQQSRDDGDDPIMEGLLVASANMA